MATRHELDIEITPDGKVSVTVKGAKGKKCMDYIQIFDSIGKIVEQHNTREYYEAELNVNAIDHTRNRTGF